MSDYYPDPPMPLFTQRAPSVNGSITSAASADSLDGRTINAMHRRLLAYLEQHGPSTDEQMQIGMPMPASTQRPRRVELVRAGLVVQDGTRQTMSGRYATVWRRA